MPRRTLPVFPGDDVGMRPAFRNEIAESLRSGSDPWTVAAAAAVAFDRLTSDVAATNHGGGDPPACHAGCSSCCHQRVDVTAPEVIALAMWLVAEKSPIRLEAIRARTEVVGEAIRGLGTSEVWQRRIRCPLLEEDGVCGGYAARPIACRRAHSTRVAACEGALATGADDIIPANPAYQENGRLASIGYFEGFATAGRPLAIYELAQALALALVDLPAVRAKWARGADPFASALTHRADDLERSFGGRLRVSGS